MSLNLCQLNEMLLSTSVESLENILEYLCVYIQNSECEKVIIAIIKDLLKNNQTRCKGFQLIKALLMYFSYEAVTQNVPYWTNNCIVYHAEDTNKGMKLNTLVTILEHSSNMDFFHKKFPAEYLAPTVKACLSSRNSDEKVVGLRCLSQLLRRYPTWFGNHREKIEIFLIECLENSDEETTKHSAIAFVYFLEVGGAGINGVNYIGNFSYHFTKFCCTVHSLFNSFFEGIVEINTVKMVGDVYKFNQSTHGFDARKIMEITTVRIINCLIFIETLIVKHFAVEKRIVPKYLIEIVCRGLSIHLCFSKQPFANADIYKCTLIRKIQLRLLKITRMFILGFHSNLIPFATIFTKHLINLLKKLNLCDCYTFDWSYKVSVYKTLLTWLKVNKDLNGPHLQEISIPAILCDISSTQKNIFLKLETSGQKSRSVKGSPHREHQSDLRHYRNNHKGDSCIYALEILQCLLRASSLKVDQFSIQAIMLFFAKNINELQNGKLNVTNYTNIKCQVKFYEVLISCFTLENFQALSSMHLIVNVLSNGLTSSNPKIQQISSNGLHFLKKICQPMCATLEVQNPGPPSMQQISRIVSVSLEGKEHRAAKSMEKADLVGGAEIFAGEEEDFVKKEINVISNIIISKSTNDTEESIITDTADKTVENIKKQNDCGEINEHAWLNNSSEPASELLFKEVLKTKDQDTENSLEKMFCSFQDMVQE